MESTKKRAEEANREAFERLTGAEPVLVGCDMAGRIMPGFKRNLILHSGPPIAFKDMRPLHRNGTCGAAVFEGLAKDAKEAGAMLESGELELGEANDHHSGGPGAGITSFSMTVLRVVDAKSGTEAFAAPVEGPCGGGLGGWGVYNTEIDANLKLMASRYAPLLDQLLKDCGGIPVKPLFAAGLLAGDEEHTRQVATDKLFLGAVVDALAKSSLGEKDKLDLIVWLNSCKRFVHHIGTATAVACLKAASGVEGASLVTAMCGNGVEFGIKTSGRGERWHVAPAPSFKGRCFKPEWSDADAAPWLGDSSNVEAFGLGGMAAAAAPALGLERGQSCADLREQYSAMRRICFGGNEAFKLPLMDGACAPAGILPELVLENGILPVLHGGMMSRSGSGQIGIGVARTPLECFKKAL